MEVAWTPFGNWSTSVQIRHVVLNTTRSRAVAALPSARCRATSDIDPIETVTLTLGRVELTSRRCSGTCDGGRARDGRRDPDAIRKLPNRGVGTKTIMREVGGLT